MILAKRLTQKEFSVAILVMSAFIFCAGCEGPTTKTDEQKAAVQPGTQQVPSSEDSRNNAAHDYAYSLTEEVEDASVREALQNKKIEGHPRRLKRPYPTEKEMELALGSPDEASQEMGSVRWGDVSAEFKGGRLSCLTITLKASAAFHGGNEQICRDASL